MFRGNSDPILRWPLPFFSFLSLKDSEVIPVIPKINPVSKDIHTTYICMPTCVHACLDIMCQWLSLNPNLQQTSQFSVITHLHICTQILFEKGIVFVAFNKVIVQLYICWRISRCEEHMQMQYLKLFQSDKIKVVYKSFLMINFGLTMSKS